MFNSVFSDCWKNRKTNALEKLLPNDFYRRIAKGEINRVFYPPFSDRKAWAAFGKCKSKKELKESIIAQADAIMQRPLEALSTYNYFRFILEGDRARFEQAYFRRRANLGNLVMALCLTGDKEKYLPPVIDCLGAITAEPFWCLPAHALRDSDPMPSLQTAEWVDLFAAETAMVVSLALQLLRDELAAFSPRFYRICKDTVLKKAVLPVLDHFELASWTHGTGNWTAWCAANVLLSGAILLDDPLQLAELTRKMVSSTSGYYEAADDDGYCDEGPGYWFKAAAQMFSFCRTLDAMLPGSAEAVFRDPKFRDMAEFGALSVIYGRDQVVSGDCGHVSNDGSYTGFIYDFGAMLHSDQLKTFALNRMHTDPRRRPVVPEEAAVCRFGNGDHLQILLDMFFKMPADPEKAKKTKLPPFSFWPGRLGIIRHADGFSAALKAGHNAEKHNHNDLGHFTLYYKDQPVVIDLGTGMYSRKNFSPDRYSLYYTSAAGHNALCFGKNIQQPGREFEADLTMPDKQTLTADLAKAYPEAAGVQKYVRTLHCGKTEAVISDTVQLKKKTAAVSALYTICDVRKRKDGTLDFGGGIRCTLKGAECTAIEPVALKDIPRHWGSRLWKITIKMIQPESEFVFTCNNKKGMK